MIRGLGAEVQPSVRAVRMLSATWAGRTGLPVVPNQLLGWGLVGGDHLCGAGNLGVFDRIGKG
ncbi:hypothetical protein GCM10010493_41320 [Streptomyces lavendulae subsp. grasserius]